MIKWLKNLFSLRKKRFNCTHVIVTDWVFDKKTGEFYPVEHVVKLP